MPGYTGLYQIDFQVPAGVTGDDVPVVLARRQQSKRYAHGRDSLSPQRECKGPPDCKPVSVPLRAAVIPLGRTLLSGSSDLPGSPAERAAPPPLFGLAPRGVCHAGRIAPAAVRSYRTISPLPRRGAAVYFLLRFP